MRRALPLLALLLAVGALAIVANHFMPAPERASATTSTAPDSFDLPRLDGRGEVRLSDFYGKPTVVDLFASWCPSCRADLPIFAKVSHEFRTQVTFVGVDSLDAGNGLATAREFHIDWWPLARDVGGSAASGLHDALGLGMPLTAFYDQRGRLEHVAIGEQSEQGLRSELRPLYGFG